MRGIQSIKTFMSQQARAFPTDTAYLDPRDPPVVDKYRATPASIAASLEVNRREREQLLEDCLDAESRMRLTRCFEDDAQWRP